MFCPSCGKDIHDESAFCLACGKPISAPKGAKEPFRFSLFKAAFLVLLGVIAFGIVVNAVSGSLKESAFGKAENDAFIAQLKKTPEATAPAPALPPPPPPESKYTLRKQPLFTGQTVVGPQRKVGQCFSTTAAMLSPKVTGKFQASGGNGNDIQAVLGEQSEYENYMNGHTGTVLYVTPGPITNGSVDAFVPREGRYCFGFLNVALFTTKYVFGDVDLVYAELQPATP